MDKIDQVKSDIEQQLIMKYGLAKHQAEPLAEAIVNGEIEHVGLV